MPTGKPDPDRPVALAAIAGAHGVTGEVRLKLFAQSLESLKRHKAYAARGAVLTLVGVRDGPTGPIARFAEIADRSAADALRGAELSVPRSALPPPADGEVYVADLLGLPVRTPDGVAAGTVVGHEDFGAGDLLEIERPDGARFLIPFARCAWTEGELEIDPAFLE